MRKTLNRKEIDAIFEAHNHQSDVCIALYELAFPEWNSIKSMDGWPGVGKEAGLYIIRKFMEFDRKHHPDVLNGGLWMNKGFSTHDGADMGLGPWELSTDNCNIELTAPVPAAPKQTKAHKQTPSTAPFL